MTHDSLSLHQVNATLHKALLKLHAKSQAGHTINTRVIKTQGEMNVLRDTIHQQAAHPVVAIIDGDPMAGPIELICGGQSCRARPDNRNLLPCANLRRVRNNPTHLKPLLNPGHSATRLIRRSRSRETHFIDDRTLNALDPNGLFIDTQHAGAFTWSGADPSRELREVVGKE